MADWATELGVHGYPIPPIEDEVAVSPNSGDTSCAYLTLICTRAQTLNTPIDANPVNLGTTIDVTVNLKTLICTRATTLNTPIDDDAVTLNTPIVDC